MPRDDRPARGPAALRFLRPRGAALIRRSVPPLLVRCACRAPGAAFGRAPLPQPRRTGPPSAFAPSRPAAFCSGSTLLRRRAIPPASSRQSPGPASSHPPTRSHPLTPPRQPTRARPQLPGVAPARLHHRPAAAARFPLVSRPCFPHPLLPELHSRGQAHRTAATPRRAGKGPTPRTSPHIFGSRPPAENAGRPHVKLRSSHAGNKARFAEGVIGEGPKPPLPCPGLRPVILLGFRSRKRPLLPHKAGSAACPLGASARPQPPRQGIQGPQ